MNGGESARATHVGANLAPMESVKRIEQICAKCIQAAKEAEIWIQRLKIKGKLIKLPIDVDAQNARTHVQPLLNARV